MDRASTLFTLWQKQTLSAPKHYLVEEQHVFIESHKVNVIVIHVCRPKAAPPCSRAISQIVLKTGFLVPFCNVYKGPFRIRSLNILGWIYIFKLSRALLVKLGTYREDVRVKI